MRDLQITFDARDPEGLARFWCEVLGYELEPPPPGFDTWEDFLRDAGVPAEQWGARSAARDPNGSGPRLFFQRVSEVHTEGPIHLDISVSHGSHVPIDQRRQAISGEADRLLALGARVRRTVDRDHEFWVVMEDPEGNAFCLQ